MDFKRYTVGSKENRAQEGGTVFTNRLWMTICHSFVHSAGINLGLSGNFQQEKKDWIHSQTLSISTTSKYVD